MWKCIILEITEDPKKSHNNGASAHLKCSTQSMTFRINFCVQLSFDSNVNYSVLQETRNNLVINNQSINNDNSVAMQMSATLIGFMFYI